MRYTQFLIFEVCPQCNFGEKHKAKCPNMHPERCRDCDKKQPMTDDQICAVAIEAYEAHGFRGAVGWHYYNEPLCARERIITLAGRIRQAVPRARFILWTNGALFPDNLDFLGIFEKIWISNYDRGDFSRIREKAQKVIILPGRLDDRAGPMLAHDDFSPCRRMFSEMIFDYWGNVHICCIDWRGSARIGNIHKKTFSELLAIWKNIREAVSIGKHMDGARAPEVCRRCRHKLSGVVSLLPDIAGAAAEYVKHPPEKDENQDTDAEDAAESVHISKQPPEAARKTISPATVFVSYRIPEERLRAHFAWNDALYRAQNMRVFVVVDREYSGLPEYCRQLVYPQKMEIFSLAATKNYGIRHAIESGHNPIISTDVDIAFSPEIFEKLSTAPDERHAVIPIYRMVDTLETRGKYILAPNATGTVSMLADTWREIHYHEGCIGYGCDDGVLLAAIRRRGLRVARYGGVPIWHIAHIAGTPQKEFCKENPRIDHWGRDSGFNPENFRGNAEFMKNPIYTSPFWGLAGGSDIAFVVAHWRMPEHRLRDFIAWNTPGFQRIGARLVIVDDEYHGGLPPWARVAVYPQPLKIFSLARVSNYGIRLIGRGVIVKTDIDCIFSDELLNEIANLKEGDILCPLYRMAANPSAEARRLAKVWDAAKGTIAAHWSAWNAICGYDERMEGYGIEDGDCFWRMEQKLKTRGRRECGDLWHIAHCAGDILGARQQWNREINPGRHAQNQAARKKEWRNERWGYAD